MIIFPRGLGGGIDRGFRVIINLKIQLSNIFHLLNYLRLLIRSEN
jgi:hypothetical protein